MQFAAVEGDARLAVEALADSIGTEQGALARSVELVAAITTDAGDLAGYCGFTPGRITDVGGVYINCIGLDPAYRGQGAAVIVALCRWLADSYSDNGVFCGHAVPGSAMATVAEVNLRADKTEQPNGLNFYCSSVERL